MKFPTTPDEWQDAVDTAEFLLRLDSARQYGLVAGGPEIDFERCVTILRLGRARGVEPAPDCVERIGSALAGG